MECYVNTSKSKKWYLELNLFDQIIKLKRNFKSGKITNPWNSFHQVNCSEDQTIQFNPWWKIFSFLICEQIKGFHFILFSNKILLKNILI